MKRRDFVWWVAVSSVGWPGRTRAQASKGTYRIGLLGLLDRSPYDAPIANGLAKHGYVIDQNLVVVRAPPQGL